MPLAQGTAKVVSYKKETNWGVPAGASGAQQLRRVTASFNLVKETYESNEIRTDRQVADMRHGVRSAEGTLNGELSSQTYSDFMGSLLARDFTAVAPVTIASLDISAGLSGTWELERGAGDFIVDGYNVGQVIRLTATTIDAANENKNLLVTGVATDTLTVVVMNGTAMVAETVTACDIVSPGQRTYVPKSGHTDQSYTIEEWYSDINQSEVYTGMKVGNMNVQLPASGLATVDFTFQGKDMSLTNTTQYFTAPTAQGSDGIYAAVSGLLVFNGVPIAVVTSVDFSVERALENAQVVGSNSIAEIFTGRIRTTGNMSVYFTDAEFRDKFDDEIPVSIVFAFTEGTAPDAKVLTFTLPKVKVGSFTKDDSETGLVASSSFVGILNDVTGTGLPETTIQIQDTAL